MNDHPTPKPIKIIRDLDTLKVLTDPLRMRILALLRHQPRTVKEVAQALAIPPTRLYYHFNLLERHDLIRVVGTRLVSGILEKRYQVTAFAFDVDHRLLALHAEEETGWPPSITRVVESLRQDLNTLVATGRLRHLMETASTQGTPVPLRLSHAMARLTPTQVAAFLDRLRRLVEEFEAHSPPADQESALYTLFLAFYPTPAPPEEATQPPDQNNLEDTV
ncbi:MAG TPA: helix-turn-helix transcriptional regulator [Anaerolineae bacterium]|nr:helix-turn-helix transcriptional regulator [Anaerolineae bacterium]HID83759.1 ArsR family transcriptional regulator [Anaerolineales bacterium]HIQ09053.1 ArsR family transcriptional regulator [Anaerolineaceae bacterium]